MVLKIRHIFGCDHAKRYFCSNVFFERGFKIPALYCEGCCGDAANVKPQQGLESLKI